MQKYEKNLSLDQFFCRDDIFLPVEEIHVINSCRETFNGYCGFVFQNRIFGHNLTQGVDYQNFGIVNVCSDFHHVNGRIRCEDDFLAVAAVFAQAEMRLVDGCKGVVARMYLLDGDFTSLPCASLCVRY